MMVRRVPPFSVGFLDLDYNGGVLAVVISDEDGRGLLLARLFFVVCSCMYAFYS
jgi:hypothetical protein